MFISCFNGAYCDYVTMHTCSLYCSACADIQPRLNNLFVNEKTLIINRKYNVWFVCVKKQLNHLQIVALIHWTLNRYYPVLKDQTGSQERSRSKGMTYIFNKSQSFGSFDFVCNYDLLNLQAI